MFRAKHTRSIADSDLIAELSIANTITIQVAYLFGEISHFLFVQYICVDTMMHVSPGLSRKFRGSTNGSTTGSDSMGIEGAKCGPTIYSNSKEL